MAGFWSIKRLRAFRPTISHLAQWVTLEAERRDADALADGHTHNPVRHESQAHNVADGLGWSLALATDLAIRAELEYGLGHDLIWQHTESAHRLMPERLRRVVQDRLRRAERAARADLEKYRADLERIAHELMDKRELNADELKALLAPVSFPDTKSQRGSPPAATM